MDKQITITEYRLTKIAKRSGERAVIFNWASDIAETRQELVAVAKAAMTANRFEVYYTLELETREVIHEQVRKVEAAEWNADYQYEQVIRDAEQVIRLLQGRIDTIQRRIDAMKNEDVEGERKPYAAQQLLDEVYREVVTIVGNVHIDSMMHDVRNVERSFQKLEQERAELAKL